LTLFDPTNKMLLKIIEKKLKNLKTKNVSKQPKTNQNILKMLSNMGINKINIWCKFKYLYVSIPMYTVIRF